MTTAKLTEYVIKDGDTLQMIAKDYLHKHPQPYRHYTFIVQNRRIVEWGIKRTGSPMTHVGYADHTKIHSELDAYSKARGIMDKDYFEAVNIRITKSGIIRNLYDTYRF
jgi:hypothetical protein